MFDRQRKASKLICFTSFKEKFWKEDTLNFTNLAVYRSLPVREKKAFSSLSTNSFATFWLFLKVAERNGSWVSKKSRLLILALM